MDLDRPGSLADLRHGSRCEGGDAAERRHLPDDAAARRAVGNAASFSVRAERLAPSAERPNRLEARCIAVEYFGCIRRYVLGRPDGEAMKLDQIRMASAFFETNCARC